MVQLKCLICLKISLAKFQFTLYSKRYGNVINWQCMLVKIRCFFTHDPCLWPSHIKVFLIYLSQTTHPIGGPKVKCHLQLCNGLLECRWNSLQVNSTICARHSCVLNVETWLYCASVNTRDLNIKSSIHSLQFPLITWHNSPIFDKYQTQSA